MSTPQIIIQQKCGYKTIDGIRFGNLPFESPNNSTEMQSIVLRKKLLKYLSAHQRSASQQSQQLSEHGEI